MGRLYDGVNDELAGWLRRQPIFFVATAPALGGHVNVSPKGLDTFAVLDQHRVAYLDLTGSGIETIAHVRDNGRITLMFCAFTGPPRIVRLSGTGRVIGADDEGYADLEGRWPRLPGARAVIAVDLDRVADSCGFGVPLMDHVGERDDLRRSAERRGVDGLREYRATRNAVSIDGLPGLRGEIDAAPSAD